MTAVRGGRSRPAPSITLEWLVAWIDQDGTAHEHIVAEQEVWFLIMALKQGGAHNVRWRRV